MLYFCFHLFLSVFQFPLWFLSCAIGCSRMCYLNLHKVVNFPVFLLVLFLTSSHFSPRKLFIWYLSFKIYWDWACGRTYDLSWKLSHGLLRKICKLLLGRVLGIHLLGIAGFLLSPLFSYLPVCLFCPLLRMVGVWEAPIIGELSVSPLDTISFCFLYFDGIVIRRISVHVVIYFLAMLNLLLI